jgi:hypothetical protein
LLVIGYPFLLGEKSPRAQPQTLLDLTHWLEKKKAPDALQLKQVRTGVNPKVRDPFLKVGFS